MAQRYLEKHSLLGPRRLVDLGSLLSEEAEQISSSRLAELTKHVTSTQNRLKVTDARRAELEATINDFRKAASLTEEYSACDAAHSDAPLRQPNQRAGDAF